MVGLIFDMAMKKFWFRYYCFSLFKSDRINRILLWVLIPMSLLLFYYSKFQVLSTALPYKEALAQLQSYQWYIYFNSKEFYILFLSIIVWNNYKHTRDAAIATAVLVKSIYDTIGAYLDLPNKYETLDLAWQVFIYALLVGLLSHSIWRYWSNARKERDI